MKLKMKSHWSWEREINAVRDIVNHVTPDMTLEELYSIADDTRRAIHWVITNAPPVKLKLKGREDPFDYITELSHVHDILLDYDGCRDPECMRGLMQEVSNLLLNIINRRSNVITLDQMFNPIYGGAHAQSR